MGRESGTQAFHTGVPRTESLPLVNDSRSFSDSVLTKRLNAFTPIVVAAVLLSSLAFGTVTGLQPQVGEDWSWLTYVALAGMMIVTMLDLFCVFILTHQMYLVGSLMAGGSIGFEMAKSFFQNRSVEVLRNAALRAFNESVWLFVLSAACMVYKKNRVAIEMAVLVGIMVACGLSLWYISVVQRCVADNQLRLMVAESRPLQERLERA